MYGATYRQGHRSYSRPTRARDDRSGSRPSPYSFMDYFYRRYGSEPVSHRTRSSARESRATDNVDGAGAQDGRTDVPMEIATTEELQTVIHVTGVNMHIADNANAHRTSEYDIVEAREDDFSNAQEADLVLRRGQSFDISISFNREYKVDTDDVQLIFSIGRKPVAHKRTLIKIPMCETKASGDQNDPNQWRAQLLGKNGNDINVRVYIGAGSIIGEWDLSIQTILEKTSGDDKPKIYEYKVSRSIFILLNPWCKDDAVYMPTTDLLNEYILEENGFQYYGNHRQIGAMPWLFGQFEEGIMEVSLSLLHDAFNGEYSDKMADPVRISRALSKMVNSCDDNGVLTGNWSGNYEGGATPTSWNGSVAILKQYEATRKPVKFGQCWVFSGVLTAVCRSIGLPARSVTNFRSAHDTDNSVAIDKHFQLDKNNTRSYIDDLNNDSIWNFHVWNEVWMARRDLGSGFDGWQALDATPQETSDNVFQCGPCPITALKNGKILTPYDGAFLFAEVNAHVVHWEAKDPTFKDWDVSEIEAKDVGRHISTKTPFRDTRMDVTHEYKYSDGTDKEVTVMKTVAQYLGDGAREYLVKEKDVVVTLKDIDEILIGNSFEVSAKLKNNCSEVRTANAYLVAMTTTYTGRTKDVVKSDFDWGKKINPGEEITVKMEVPFDVYYPRLVEGSAMKIRVEVTLQENKQTSMCEDDFRLMKPTLQIKSSDSNPLKVTLDFVNPLPIALTSCQINLDCRSIAGGSKVITPSQQTVQPGEKFSETVEYKIRKPGRKHIIATFECAELWDVTGSTYAKVPA